MGLNDRLAEINQQGRVEAVDGQRRLVRAARTPLKLKGICQFFAQVRADGFLHRAGRQKARQ